MAKILIVEDDDAVSDIIGDFCKRDRHTVDIVPSGIEAVDRLKTYYYDLVILDWQLPDLSGVEVCKAYRDSSGTAAILMLTGRNTILDKEAGFGAGADDYLTKPFDLRELSLRINAMLRRPRTYTPRVLKFAHVKLDPGTHEVTSNGVKIDLLPKEFALLELFLRHPTQVFSLDALIDRVWSSDTEVTQESVRTCLHRVRRKIEQPGCPNILATVYGVGYKLEAPGESH